MTAKAEQMIEELLADPQTFFDAGRGYELLQEYFRGLPIATLRPLLRSSVYPVQRTAAFILSELGQQAVEVVDDAIPLLRSGDRALCFAAMEAIAVCSDVTTPSRFVHVVNMLESEDEVLRGLAMYLASRVSLPILAATLRASVDANHQRGLQLISRADASVDEARALLRSDNALLARYGAIAAKRMNDGSLLAELAESKDPAVQKLRE